MLAKGTFEVKLTSQSEDKAEVSTLGRFLLEKKYRGDLDGESTGEMLSALTDTKGSAGYVALERFTGTLRGLVGSFVLQHSGAMNRGAMELSVKVVPDSGSDQLAGLSGMMKIIIAEGAHSYEFEYSISPPA
ncbi:MAG TPA: DUF3224 domain-containing protein [Candidatus Binatia bacterium]|jgi:predicted flavoprotein YhiN|nr:DUF3224 domain-containing protein [Candidatus Binatia bacterium]